jgi:phosphoenolpyruvate-protein kinase (PTS system EI component)
MKTRNERILFALVLLIVLGAGNFYGYEWLAGKQRSLDLQYAELRADKAEAEVELQNPAMWTARKSWIEQHEPAAIDEGTAKAQVLEAALKAARDQHLEILEQTLNDVQHGPAGARVSIALKVKGPMEGLCHWLAAWQKPESLQAVSQLSLKADEDQTSMVGTVQLDRYFKAGP